MTMQILSLLENGNGKVINSIISVWTRARSLLFSSKLNSLLLSNWALWNNRERKWNDAKFIFQRRFHGHRRCRIQIYILCEWKTLILSEKTSNRKNVNKKASLFRSISHVITLRSHTLFVFKKVFFTCDVFKNKQSHLKGGMLLKLRGKENMDWRKTGNGERARTGNRKWEMGTTQRIHFHFPFPCII